MIVQSIVNFLRFVIGRGISNKQDIPLGMTLKDYVQNEIDLSFPSAIHHNNTTEVFVISNIESIKYFSRLVKECAEEIIFYINGAVSAMSLLSQNPDHPLIRHATSPDSLTEYMLTMEESGIVDSEAIPSIIASVGPESFGDLGPTIGTHWRRWSMLQPNSKEQQTIHPFALQDEDIGTIDSKTLSYLSDSWDCLDKPTQAQFQTKENYLKLYLASETDQLGKVIQAIKEATSKKTTELAFSTMICDNPTYRKITKLPSSHQPYAKRASLEPLAKVMTFTIRERVKAPSLPTVSYDYQTNLNVTLASPKGIDVLLRAEIMYMMLLSIVAAATNTMPGKLTFFIDEFMVTDEDIRRESQDASCKTKATVTFDRLPAIESINSIEFDYVKTILDHIKIEPILSK